MSDLLELARFILTLAGFLVLLSLPAAFGWAVRAGRKRSTATDEALAIADEVRAELAEVVEAIKEQTKAIEAWADERDERIAVRS